jgi:hypothetical protein
LFRHKSVHYWFKTSIKYETVILVIFVFFCNAMGIENASVSMGIGNDFWSLFFHCYFLAIMHRLNCPFCNDCLWLN